MKHNLKASFFIIMAVFIACTSLIANPGKASAESLDLNAESAILVDAETGKILYAKQPDIKLPPASMTKMMTEYLVLEAIDEGQISWDTTTQISDYPYQISASSISSGVGLTQDIDYTVRELYEAMAIISDNGTTIALAELIAGSEGEFVKMMNEKAEEMGLPDYQFVNSTGLSNSDLGENYPEGTEPDAENLMSAESTALLAYRLVNDYPEALEISSKMTTEFEGKTLENLNWMLPWDNVNFKQFGFEGVDGLKTGWTDLAGYCFTGTAERDGRRLISVVMKTDSKEARFEETAKLLDYGFSQFENKEAYPEGYQKEDQTSLPVAKGKEDQVEIAANQAINAAVKKGEEESYSVTYNIDQDKLNEDGELVAPIEEGETVGTMELAYEGEADYGYITGQEAAQSVDLVTKASVEKANWFALSMSAVGSFFSNIFSSVTDTVKGWF
ncbi:serine hydrolase [Sediminibacillus albus]|uniref:serine-type D-Ala-D-Ala carboxypeptidase n=1 Tax=Sediminibacillus albus TaxID=407036 RepID=A0A1G9A7Y8_9BACI|nr:serine hydrolase [Sediminibacillus albus]SDK23466.1 D-alanyl-D-alanine carboxypeptidase (penicillin-binding protein 5/6) [Sediminibacillus albus]